MNWWISHFWNCQLTALQCLTSWLSIENLSWKVTCSCLPCKTPAFSLSLARKPSFDCAVANYSSLCHAYLWIVWLKAFCSHFGWAAFSTCRCSVFLFDLINNLLIAYNLCVCVWAAFSMHRCSVFLFDLINNLLIAETLCVCVCVCVCEQLLVCIDV